MVKRGTWLSGLALLFAGSAASPPAMAQERASPPRSPWTRPTLTPFAGEGEFRRYLRALQDRRAQAPRQGARIQFAQSTGTATQSDVPTEPVCPPDDPACAGPADMAVVVTGTARATSNPSITNVQESGVDEGDIVKQVGKYLLVLQDGRIFVTDTRPAGQPGLALTDSANVYRSPDEDTWYDEMLVSGDRVLITGYSYREEATELAVFRLDTATGRLRREGIFFMSSNDYYDTENYASRLVGDNLVVYTPIDLSDIEYESKIEWPVVRRWQPERSRTRPGRGSPLLDARDIYRPVRDTAEPWLHTVSICPLRSAGSGGNLQCRTTGFIGEGNHEFHVSPTDAYIWTSQDAGYDFRRGSTPCGAGSRPSAAESVPALLFRLPLDPEADVGVIGVRGIPIDYLSLDTGGGRFRALTRWPVVGCARTREPTPLTYMDVSVDRFDATLRDVPERAYTGVPSVGTNRLENRFTDHYLVYGGRRYWGSYPPDEPGQEPNLAAAVPFARPAGATLIPVPHSVLRVERAGNNVVMTGYRDDSGLDVSLIDLRAAPRLASTAHLQGRYETEGRSHVFNSLIEADASGLMGVPTTHRISRSGRWWSYSEASDVSFLAADAAGRLSGLGELVAYANGPDRDNEDDAISDEGVWHDYACEVSCIDWYGNSRPIFTDGRVFGLAGGELIEGRVEGGRIREVRRLNMTVGTRPTPRG